jgi:hypothetical protein
MSPQNPPKAKYIYFHAAVSITLTKAQQECLEKCSTSQT